MKRTNEEKNEYRFVLWDSHKRPMHDGAAFLLFSTNGSLIRYLQKLFPPMDLNGVSDLQQDLYNRIGMTTVKLKVSPNNQRIDHDSKLVQDLKDLEEKVTMCFDGFHFYMHVPIFIKLDVTETN